MIYSFSQEVPPRRPCYVLTVMSFSAFQSTESLHHGVMASTLSNSTLDSSPLALEPSVQTALLPTLAIISLILCSPPLTWHIRNRNLAASALVFWIMLENIFNFVNPLIWPTDRMTTWWHGYGLCDMETKLTIASNIGFPASLLCVIRYLAMILDTKNTVLRSGKGYKSRQLLIEGAFCFGLPVGMMLMHLVVQDTRYYIFAIVGCVPSYDDSWVSILLIHIWGPVLSLIAGCYAVLVIIRLVQYKRSFSDILSASSSSLTTSRFLRLFFMSLVLVLGALPLQLYGLVENFSHYEFKSYSWRRVHAHWEDIILIPTFGQVTVDHWVQVAVGFTVFIFFGMGKDATKLYRSWLLAVGLGKIWPSLRRDGSTRGGEKGSSARSFGSRAQLWVKDRFSSRDSWFSGFVQPRLQPFQNS